MSTTMIVVYMIWLLSSSINIFSSEGLHEGLGWVCNTLAVLIIIMLEVQLNAIP